MADYTARTGLLAANSEVRRLAGDPVEEFHHHLAKLRLHLEDAERAFAAEPFSASAILSIQAAATLMNAHAAAVRAGWAYDPK